MCSCRSRGARGQPLGESPPWGPATSQPVTNWGPAPCQPSARIGLCCKRGWKRAWKRGWKKGWEFGWTPIVDQLYGSIFSSSSKCLVPSKSCRIHQRIFSVSCTPRAWARHSHVQNGRFSVSCALREVAPSASRSDLATTEGVFCLKSRTLKVGGLVGSERGSLASLMRTAPKRSAAPAIYIYAYLPSIHISPPISAYPPNFSK